VRLRRVAARSRARPIGRRVGRAPHRSEPRGKVRPRARRADMGRLDRRERIVSMQSADTLRRPAIVETPEVTSHACAGCVSRVSTMETHGCVCFSRSGRSSGNSTPFILVEGFDETPRDRRACAGDYRTGARGRNTQWALQNEAPNRPVPFDALRRNALF
jgi:hypothetical protein